MLADDGAGRGSATRGSGSGGGAEARLAGAGGAGSGAAGGPEGPGGRGGVPSRHSGAAFQHSGDLLPRRDALDGVDRLVVDGTNVLHALRRSPEPLPATALIGRLRAVVPPAVTVVLVLDGSPEHGLKTSRVASGVLVRYSGHDTADALIRRLVDERRHDAEATAAMLVVTDDADLGWSVRRLGARTVPARWLVIRLARQRLDSPAAGQPRPPRPVEPERGGDDAQRWSPGRGATRKRGNAKRSPKRGGR